MAVATMRERIAASEQREASMGGLLEMADRAYRLAVHIVGSPDAAEDVVQQSYLEALGKIRPGADPERERVWFFTMVANRAKDHLRSEGRRKQREAAVSMQESRSASLDVAETDGEMLAALRGVVATLDADYRLPLLLYYQEEMSQSEVAAVLQMAQPTVSKYITAGLAKLRKAMERAGYAAAVAVVLGGLKRTAPRVPASLRPRLEARVAKGLAWKGGGIAATATKGGVVMKVIAGLVLAGSVAAGLAVVGGGGDGSLPAAAAKASADGAAYVGEVLAGQFVLGNTLGPGRITQGSWSDNRVFSEKRKRFYGFDSDGTMLKSWDPETGLVEHIAGCGALGDLDAGAESWRGNANTYGGAGVGLDDERGVLYVCSSKRIKAISLEDGSMRTVAPFTIRTLCLGSDGKIYYCTYQGVCRLDPATGKTQQLSKESFPQDYHPGARPWTFMAVDPARGKAYGHARVNVWQLDFKTGKFSLLAGKGKVRMAASSFKDTSWHCPRGMNWGPEGPGRYLYVGAGDEPSTWLRLDLEKRWKGMLGRVGDAKNPRFAWGNVSNRAVVFASTFATDRNTGDIYYAQSVWPALVRLKRVK